MLQKKNPIPKSTGTESYATAPCGIGFRSCSKPEKTGAESYAAKEESYPEEHRNGILCHKRRILSRRAQERNPRPQKKHRNGILCHKERGPLVDEIDDGIAGIVENPEAVQGSPSSVFSWTCSSMSSESTSFLRWRLSWRAAILRSLSSSTAWRRLPVLTCCDTILEELFLPQIEEVDGELMFLTDVRDGLLLQEVETKQSDLLLRGKMTTLASHGMSSARVLPLTLRKANSSSG